jgi:hypothetical protein
MSSSNFGGFPVSLVAFSASSIASQLILLMTFYNEKES